MRKKIVSIMLASLIIFGCAACGKKDGQGNTSGPVKFELWGAPATEKVLQDKIGLAIYDSFRTQAAINITVARGEYESAQIIITAESDLTYDITLSALTNASNVTFPVSDIEVFHEKYIKVSSNEENNDMPVGMYPDALVPFHAIKAKGENTVKKDENQGLYFRFNVGADQPAGKYTGAFTITIGSRIETIPVVLNIANVTVSEESHARSLFLNGWWYAFKGELDSSQAMMDKYTEALFDYRLNPHSVIVDTAHTDQDIAYYTEKAYNFMQNPKCTNISIPHATTVVNGEYCFDPVIFDKYLTSYAEKSFETGFNMFDKSICYFHDIIDEPIHNNLLNRVKVVTAKFDEQVNATADRLRDDSTVSADNKAEVIESLRNLPHLVTSAYDEDYAESISTWCPQIIEYHDENDRNEYYGAQEQKWWYTSAPVRAPHPTYHTEDTLLSARAMGWMQAEYETGNLFWSTDIYAQRDENDSNLYWELEDYYNGDAARWPKANGDGYLFYPGKPYGIDGPVGSLRLEAIRDGLEEYELLYAMKQTYSEISALTGYDFSSAAVVKNLSDLIYNGTKVATTTDKFYSAREALMNLSALSEGDAQFCIVDYIDDGFGTKTFKFFAAGDAVVKNDGLIISDVTSVTGGKMYTLPLKMGNAVNALNISVETGGATFTYTQPLGGKATVNAAADTVADEFSSEGITPVYSLVNTDTVIPERDGKAAKLDLPASPRTVLQSFRMSGKFLTGIDESTDKVVFHFYYGGDDTPRLNISAKHLKYSLYVELINTRLQKGVNVITVSVANKNWSKLSYIDYLRIYVGGNTGEPARTIYLTDIAVYRK